MHRSTFVVMASSAAALTLTFCAGLLVAGPLDPPAGEIAPTFKTLTEVEPRTALSAANTPGDADSVFRISQPGSYYLTGNLTVEAGKNGIEIAAHNVTIDLNGFTIIGLNEEGRAGIMRTLHQLRNVHIRNGGVRDFGGADGAGIDVADSDDWSRPRVGVIEGVRVSNCTRGIAPGGEYTVRDCVITGGATGIAAWGETLITNCHVLNTTSHGILSLTQASTVRECRVDDVHGTGIMISQGLVQDCEVAGAWMDGIMVASSGTVRGCEVRNITQDGIDVGVSGLVENNRVLGAGENGVRCGSYSRVVNNHIQHHGGSYPGTQVGVRAESGRCHIEGNTISRVDVGILASVGGCNVFGNTMMDAVTSLQLSGTHTYGPVITTTGVTSSTIPTANFRN